MRAAPPLSFPLWEPQRTAPVTMPPMPELRPVFTRNSRPIAALGLLLAVLWPLAEAQAWSLTIASASRRVFLHVGNGVLDGNLATVNTVSATLTGAQLLSGAPQTMTTDSTQSRSLYGDNYTTCPTPDSQIMVGASYRRRNNNDGPASAALRATSPANLVSANGDTIPFSQIRWTVSAPGSSVPGVIPAGTFNGATQTLTNVPANRYIENCHTFIYANSAVRAAGTYTGQVTYTLTAP